MLRKIAIVLGFTVILAVGTVAASAQTKVNVRFKPGTTIGNYNGSIRGERYLDYVIIAKKGQTLRAQLIQKSGAPAYFNIMRKGSDVAIADDARETESYRGALPANGAYVVRVYMAKADRLSRKSSTFKMSFSVEVE